MAVDQLTTALPLVLLATCTVGALVIWPLGAFPSDDRCIGVATSAPDIERSYLDDIIGTAPGWLRGTLVLAVATQVLGTLFGFLDCDSQRRAWRRGLETLGLAHDGRDEEENCAADRRVVEEAIVTLDDAGHGELAAAVRRPTPCKRAFARRGVEIRTVP
eukprot:COSAG02_NODE_814_length_16879_cov_4.389928_6_plen_160_part_00